MCYYNKRSLYLFIQNLQAPFSPCGTIKLFPGKVNIISGEVHLNELYRNATEIQVEGTDQTKIISSFSLLQKVTEKIVTFLLNYFEELK